MKQVSAKASMRRDIVDRILGPNDSSRANVRQLMLAREKGEEAITLSGVKLYSRKRPSPRTAG